MILNAPPSSATVRYGSLAWSGTVTLMAYEEISIPSTGTYQFPFDFIVPPGYAFMVLAAPPGGATSVTGELVSVYYEELRLAWNL
jgi:hypothetical protein